MASRIVQYFADKLKTVKDYPITLTKAVYDENGNRLDNKLSEIEGDITGLNNSLTDKVSGFSVDTYEAVTGLAYDATNNKLGLKVGADTVIPFSSNLIDDGVLVYYLGGLWSTYSGKACSTSNNYPISMSSVRNDNYSWEEKICHFCTNNPIDFSKYKKITVKYSTNNESWTVGIRTTKITKNYDWSWDIKSFTIPDSSSEKTVELDISTVTETGYLTLSLNGSNSNGFVSIKEVILT